MLNNINTKYSNMGFNPPDNSVPVTPRAVHPIAESAPAQNLGRVSGDNRTAMQIADNPIFAALNHLPRYMLNNFYTQVGGNWNDKSLDPTTRANSAANAERVLEHLDTKNQRRPEANNGRIDGFKMARVALPDHALRKNNIAINNTEAMALVMFTKFGYSSLT